MTMDGKDRELPLLLGLMPVMSQRTTDAATFYQVTNKPLLGSGPYLFSGV